MSVVVAEKHRVAWPAISRDLVALLLFCLLGLAISLAVFPRLDADNVETILTHVQ